SLPDKLRKTFPNLQLVGLGGATEAVIWSNFFIIERVAPEQSSIPYGKPIQNARYYILDKQLQPVPIAVEGDLFIGGEVLAEGYFGDQEKTVRSYLPDPYGLTPTARMYRTGDRARFSPDGTIEFLGRQDTQIKINGYRIETGEIEAALLTQPGVNGACVVIKGERHRLWLCAYIVSEEHNQEAIARLRANLRTKLPEYMIPAVFTCLSAFPLTANGKLDKQRLPEPTTMNGAGDRHAPPSGRYEMTIADIWKDELNCEALNATDNFFDLGGNSASLIRTHKTLENALNRTIPIVTLFQYTTLRSLAEWLAGHIENDAAGASQATAQRLSGRQRLMQQRKQRITAND
ncbi:non-ribosomal peptide synthetase, partial [Serratia bockelmannii]